MRYLLFIILFLINFSLFSWNGKTHVSLGREVLNSIVDKTGTANGVHIDGYDITLNGGQKVISDFEILNSIKSYPSYFLAGNIGPDGFPDVFTGQMATHEENTKNVVDRKNQIDFKKLMKYTCEKFGEESIKYSECKEDIKKILCEQFGKDEYVRNCYESIRYMEESQTIPTFPNTNHSKGTVLGKSLLKKIPYKYRTPYFWRMIDWGQYLLESALQPLYYRQTSDGAIIKSSHPVWKAVSNREASHINEKYLEKNSNGDYIISDRELAKDLRSQAIAFSYGYLNHIASDAFGHEYINKFVGNYFDLEDLSDLTQETTHLALEEYVAFIIRPWLFQTVINGYTKKSINNGQTKIEACEITDPFKKIPAGCEKNSGGTIVPFELKQNIPLNNLDIPVVFLAETMMSKDIEKASPLSYHIKLFQEIISFVDDFEDKLAFGYKCSDSSECESFGENSFCGENGYCSGSFSLSYKVLNDSCSEPITPSLSAYFFNECVTIGRLGDMSGLERCLGDLKNFLLFSYLKGVRERTKEGVYRWVTKSRDIMKYGIIADEELNDYRVEKKECGVSTPISDEYGYLINPDCSFSDIDYDENTLGDYYSDGRAFECQLDESRNKHYCKPRGGRLNAINHVKSYVDILNYILKPDENSDLIQLFEHACDNINRYNYVDICEYSKGLLKDEVKTLINETQSLLIQRVKNYMKPLSKMITKINEIIYKIPRDPEKIFNMAFCTSKEDISNCIKSCDIGIFDGTVPDSLFFETNIKVRGGVCNQCNFSYDECPNAKKAKERVFYEMGLLIPKVAFGLNIYSLYGENEIELDKPCAQNEGRFSCYMKKMLVAGKRASAMRDPKDSDFYQHSPFLNMAPLHNSLQLNKLSLITKSNMDDLFIDFGKNINESSCSTVDNFIYESKNARFCLSQPLNKTCIDRGVELAHCTKDDSDLYSELFIEDKDDFIKEKEFGRVSTVGGSVSVITILCPKCPKNISQYLVKE
ncbi:hypothetical protein JXR93_09985 [bacterium]|nr:hypothetical protein [bacterium]